MKVLKSLLKEKTLLLYSTEGEWLTLLMRALHSKGILVTNAWQYVANHQVILQTLDNSALLPPPSFFGTEHSQLILIGDDHEPLIAKYVECADLLLAPTASHMTAHVVRAVQRFQASLESPWAAQMPKSIHDQYAREFALMENALVHNVAHEFRTPILQIKSGMAFLGESIREHKLDVSTFAIVQEATERLEGLVNNITMLGSSITHNPAPIIVKDVITLVTRNMGRAWRTKKEMTRIKQHLANPLPPVFADKQGLVSVLHLLMENALIFSEDDITLHVTQKKNQVEFIVEDNGIGIDIDQIEAIFRPFYQVDASVTRAQSGIGIGLTIVKLILDHHNTTLALETQLGRGTKVSFTLPVHSMSTAST